MTTEEQETEQAPPVRIVQYLCLGRRWDAKGTSILLQAEGEERVRWFAPAPSTTFPRTRPAASSSAAGFTRGRRTTRPIGRRSTGRPAWRKSAAAREKRDTAANGELLKALLPWRRAYQATNYEGRLALQVQLLASLQRFPGDGDGE